MFVINQEIWKFVTREGYEDYEVSSLGRIRSNKFGRARILKPIPMKDPRIESETHYQRIYLFNKGKRLAALTKQGQASIAKKYGVSRSNIGLIQNRKSWK
jgi:NUMOD4 motif-containing protein